VTAAADAVAAELQRRGIACGVSRWDASGLFAEFAVAGHGSRGISARTLSLIYAADLAFRLRWEIRPILDAGGVVIAASYLDTAAAFGVSCGLSNGWLRELMRFAPTPSGRGRAVERKIDRPWKRRLDRGYAEYAAALLNPTTAGRVSQQERRAMIAALKESSGRKAVQLTTRGIAALAKSLTDNRRAASRRSASQPRSGRS